MNDDMIYDEAGAEAPEPVAEEPSAAEQWENILDEVDAIADDFRVGAEEESTPAVAEPEDDQITLSRDDLAQFENAYRQMADSKSSNEQLAEQVLEHVHRVATLPEDESFAEWERLRETFPQRVQQAELAYWQNEAQAPMRAQHAQYDRVLYSQVTHLADLATGNLEAQVPEADRAALRDEMRRRYIAEAEAGRLLFQTGRNVPGTRLPQVQADLQVAGRLATEVLGAAVYQSAARQNAAARRGSPTPVPPAVSGRGDGYVRSSGRLGSSGTARSWEDVLAGLDDLED